MEFVCYQYFRKLLAIPEGQNFRQKLQALAFIKIQISIHQKKALSEA